MKTDYGNGCSFVSSMNTGFKANLKRHEKGNLCSSFPEDHQICSPSRE